MVLLCGSVTIHQAVNAVRFEKLRKLVMNLRITLVLAIAFLGVQVPCLVAILRSHWKLVQAQTADNHEFAAYGLVFFLVALHAAHVLGGIIYLLMVNTKASHGAYDHENYLGVRHAALYWHFLDIVWLAMFGVLLVTG